MLSLMPAEEPFESLYQGYSCQPVTETLLSPGKPFVGVVYFQPFGGKEGGRCYVPDPTLGFIPLRPHPAGHQVVQHTV